MRRYPDDKEKASLFIERRESVDAHGGMTPREYRLAKKQWERRGEDMTGEKATRSDVMERLGEEIIEAGEDTADKTDQKEN